MILSASLLGVFSQLGELDNNYDLDTYNAGKFWCAFAHGATGYPPGITNGWCYVLNFPTGSDFSGSYRMQIAISYNDMDFYFRRRNSGGWSDWYKLTKVS